jgi:glycosyltransferase involved in cell wall biosynthesis
LGLRNVLFVDTVPRAEVVRWWSVLDVSIIHLRKTELFGTVIPSKLFECMGMGVPVLLGVTGESADIVRAEGVGQVFEPENADELAQLLLTASRDPASLAVWRANCVVAAKGYDRTALADRMLEVLEGVSKARN